MIEELVYQELKPSLGTFVIHTIHATLKYIIHLMLHFRLVTHTCDGTNLAFNDMVSHCYKTDSNVQPVTYTFRLINGCLEIGITMQVRFAIDFVDLIFVTPEWFTTVVANEGLSWRRQSSSTLVNPNDPWQRACKLGPILLDFNKQSPNPPHMQKEIMSLAKILLRLTLLEF